MRPFVLTLVAALSLAVAASAQTIPVNHRFGSVSDREIDMTVYEPDTSAVAVVLYRDYKLDLVFDPKLEIVQIIQVHERIKILKEAGKEYADYSFLYTYSNNLRESFSKVKVETYNREDGKIVKTKMNRKYLFDEKFSDSARRLSFTAENVKVGSVIEVSYEFTSPQFWNIENIEYQQEIPINEMDIDVGYAEYFRMNRTQRGGVRTVNSQDNSQKSIHLGGGDAVTYQVLRDLYKAVDVPALREESYSFCPEQYRGQVLYDMSGVSIPGAVYRDFNAVLQDLGIQYRRGGRWHLSLEFAGRGYAEDRHYFSYSLHGIPRKTTYLVWTPLGVKFLNSYVHTLPVMMQPKSIQLSIEFYNK